MNKRNLLVSLGLLASTLVLSGVFSDVTSTTVTITNDPPTVSEPSVRDPFSLTEGTTTTLFCNVTITDSNGWEDIDTVNATLFLDSMFCAANGANCYKNASCTIGTGSSTTLDVNCSFKVQFYAQASSDEGDWTCNVTVNDTSTNSAYGNTTDLTISDNLALAVNSSIGFGNLDVSEDSLDKLGQVNNTGNVRIDVNVNGSNMTCNGENSGNITPSRIKYNTTTGINWATQDSCVLSSAAGGTCAWLTTTFDLAESATANKATYWKLRVPTGVSGTCTGAITFEAEKG
jgi:hypothetical protein